MLSLGSVLEWGSWVTLVIIFNNGYNILLHTSYRSLQNQIYVAPIYLGLALNYLINIVNILFIRIKIYKDPEFQKWVHSASTHKITAL